jgi:hypothetical protein
MGKRRVGFSREQHSNASKTIRAAERLAMEIANAYGVSSKQGKVADRARLTLQKLRSAMDDAVFVEDPEKSTPELARVYYGPADDETP